MKKIPRAAQLNVVNCHACGLVCEDLLGPAHAPKHMACPRCSSALHRRKVNSIARSWAFLIAAVILYIPANVMPMMYTEFLGSGMVSTIMGGVIEFWKMGSHAIALVIFIASVAVPCTKFLVMAMLLWTAQRASGWKQRERAKLYRLVEIIGYWSMLDVIVVAVVAALVVFQPLTAVAPRVGILFFGMVVVLTMFSAMSFDPRLIWDSKNE